jgi:hypothetical protein
VSGRDLEIKYSLKNSTVAPLPTRNQTEPGLDRMPTDRGRDALIALARLLARHAARELTSHE